MKDCYCNGKMGLEIETDKLKCYECGIYFTP